MRSRLGWLVATSAIAAVLVAPSGATALNLTHTFDTNRQGWDFAGDATEGAATFDGAAGVPVGSIKGTDTNADNAGFAARFFAPAVFSGNLSASAGGTVSFDFAKSADASNGRTIALALVTGSGFGTISLTREFIPVETMTSFHHYSAPLVPGDWELCSAFDAPPCPIASPGQFADLLTDVERIVLVTDIIDGTGETYHLDNFSLTEPPAPATPATPVGQTAGATFDLAGAIKKCKRKFPKGPKRKTCIRRARQKATA